MGEEPKPGKTYGVVLTISLIVNVLLAVFSGYSSFRTATLEDEKRNIEVKKDSIEKEQKQIEEELFVEKNIPRLSTFYLITSIEAFSSFIKSKTSFPYAQQVSRYKLLENETFARLSADMQKLQKRQALGGTIQFLVIVNPGEINAYEANLQKPDSTPVAVGTIESHSALLVPIYYEHGELTTKINPLYEAIAYNSKAGDLQRHYLDTIKAPVNPSWVPILGDLRGWGRANLTQDNQYLKDLLPDSNAKTTQN